jgi:hypothetical protein
MNCLQNFKKFGVILLVALFIGATAISIAIAKSNSAFNLNSPASFPVDI